MSGWERARSQMTPPLSVSLNRTPFQLQGERDETFGGTDVASWMHPGLREQLFISLLLETGNRQDETTWVGIGRLFVEGL